MTFGSTFQAGTASSTKTPTPNHVTTHSTSHASSSPTHRTATLPTNGPEESQCVKLSTSSCMCEMSNGEGIIDLTAIAVPKGDFPSKK